MYVGKGLSSDKIFQLFKPKENHFGGKGKRLDPLMRQTDIYYWYSLWYGGSYLHHNITHSGPPYFRLSEKIWLTHSLSKYVLRLIRGLFVYLWRSERPQNRKWDTRVLNIGISKTLFFFFSTVKYTENRSSTFLWVYFRTWRSDNYQYQLISISNLPIAQ